jgi:NAD dependent epimerase/dehydratase
MDWKDKQILITGAGGFIGSHLTEQMVATGAKVRAFVHYNSRNDWGLIERLPAEVKARIEIFLGEIQDPFAVRQAVSGCEVVFHLAALIAIPYSYRAPASYVDTNVKGTLNVMQACLEAGVKKVVHTSTSETYGSARYTPIDEQHPLQGQSPYSASKIGADKIAESYWLSFGLPVATIRPFNTYGPRQSARAVIPTIISQALTQYQIHLGSLTPVRDLNYVDDTVAGFIKIAAADNSIGEVINIGFGQGITIGELAQKILSLIGKTVKIVSTDARIRPARSEVLKLVCDNRKAQKLLAWQTNYSLDAGLLATIEFIEKNLNLYKTDTYVV